MTFHGTLHSLFLEVPQPEMSSLRILDIPHLAFATGELIGLSGLSGSGKTSLLHCLAGLVAPNQGDIVWDQITITRLSAADRDAWRRQYVGLVFQDFQLIPELSVLENIMLPHFFSNWHVSTDDRMQAERQAQDLGLKDMQQRVASLSRGEQQRVAVARALWQQPSLILADEPTASLDRDNADRVMQALITYVRRHQATLIVASHDQTVLDLMGRIIPLSNGRIKMTADGAG
jgi:ABC-type lipoprotein export system ATPase subunit